MGYTPTKNIRADAVIQNNATVVTVDGTTGLLRSIQDVSSGLSLSISQNWFYYRSATSSDNNNPSGAYVFRPLGNTTTTYPVAAMAPTVQVIAGPIVNEIRQSFSNWITQSITLIGNQPQVEIRYNVGSIPIDDSYGKELITRFTTDIQSSNTWYTDSNGREFIKRIKDYRQTWSYNPDQPVAGNYYPVNAGIYLNDGTRQLTILNDRTQGGASLTSGQLEIMVHRRTLEDDWRGVGEPMNETQGITPYPYANRVGPGLGISGTHTLLLTSPGAASSVYRPFMDRIYAEPYVAFTPVANSASFITNHNTQVSFSQTSLPSNVQLLTFQPWNSAGSYLVRLSHQFAINEDANLSKPTTVDLAAIFKWNVASATEMSLTANQNKAGMKPLQWQTGNNSTTNSGVRGDSTKFSYDSQNNLTAVLVSLGPMEIKTFLVKATFT